MRKPRAPSREKVVSFAGGWVPDGKSTTIIAPVVPATVGSASRSRNASLARRATRWPSTPVTTNSPLITISADGSNESTRALASFVVSACRFTGGIESTTGFGGSGSGVGSATGCGAARTIGRGASGNRCGTGVGATEVMIAGRGVGVATTLGVLRCVRVGIGVGAGAGVGKGGAASRMTFGVATSTGAPPGEVERRAMIWLGAGRSASPLARIFRR